MLGTSEMAKRLYESWKSRMDFRYPVADREGWTRYGGLVRFDKPRPKWEHLDSIEQTIWQDVASDIATTLTDAIVAL